MAVLIKNGMVYDGLGNPPMRKDVLIREGTIARIGDFSRSRGDEVFDARGAMVTPGCIDITTHSDHHYSLFYEPTQEDFLSQGVTSIIGGNCGVSLAPLFGVLPDIATEWGSVSGINANWKTMREFLAFISKKPLGVNFGTFVGYTGLRAGITKKTFRDLSDSEMSAMLKIVEQALREGALGVSIGLEHIHGLRTPFYEIQQVAQVCAHLGRVLAIHMRDFGDDFLSSVTECVEIAKETGARVHISHMQPQKVNGKQYREALDFLSTHAGNADIWFDCNVFDSVPLLIHELLPKWAHESSFNEMIHSFKNKTFTDRIVDFLKKNAARDYIVTHIPDKTLKFLEGKSIRDLSAQRDESFEETIVWIMRVTHFRATVSANIANTAILKDAIVHTQSCISSNSAAFGKREFKMIQSISTFPEFLRFNEQKKCMGVERAIQKMTSMQARTLGLKKRGSIIEGNVADIVVWSDNQPMRVYVRGNCAWTKEGGIEKNCFGTTLYPNV